MYYEEDSSGNNGGNGSGNNNENNPFQEVILDVDNWSVNLELGYNAHPFIFSVGGSSFYNPFYSNITGVAAIKLLF